MYNCFKCLLHIRVWKPQCHYILSHPIVALKYFTRGILQLFIKDNQGGDETTIIDYMGPHWMLLT